MYSAVVVQEVLQRKREPWDEEHSGRPLEVNYDQLRAITEAVLLITTWEVAKKLNADHSKVIRHLKQTGKVKKLDKWMPRELNANQKSHCFEVSSSLILRNHFLIGLWPVMNSGRYMTTAMTSSMAGQRRCSKALPKAKPAPEKDHSHCLGVYRLSDPLQLLESQQNHYTWDIWEVCSANRWDALKGATPAAGTGQQKGSNSPWQHLTTHHTTNVSKVERVRPWSFASSAIFTWPLTNWLPLLQASWQLFAGKNLHNQQEGENAFQVFAEFWSMDFSATGMNELISCWEKSVNCNSSYFD